MMVIIKKWSRIKPLDTWDFIGIKIPVMQNIKSWWMSIMLRVSKDRYECTDFQECMDCVRTYIILGTNFTVKFDDVLKKWVIILIDDNVK